VWCSIASTREERGCEAREKELQGKEKEKGKGREKEKDRRRRGWAGLGWV
jgi:hypothetical protein